MGKKKSKARGAPRSSASVPAAEISETVITDSCRARDLVKLRRWGRQGVRVTTAAPLFLAAIEGGNNDVIRCLVSDLGADAKQANADGFTPLYVAAERGHLDIVQCLVVELGADVNQATEDGATPLYIAAQKGHLDVVRYLVTELGADVSQAHVNGATPLYIAAQMGHLDVVRCLVGEFGADVHLANHSGTTPLYVAAYFGHLEILRLSEDFGAGVNRERHNGFTPLMTAAQTNNQPLIKHLVHQGAHVRAVSKSGSTVITELKAAGATAAQIVYLEVRECCANPGCDGGGRKRCCVCKEMRYCGMACRVAHWRAHRAGCRPPIDAEVRGSGGAS
jgi:ankyrin repeat protein